MALNAYSPAVIECMEHLLHHYGYPGGCQPGSFTSSLIQTWEKADNGNRARLHQAFPELGMAITTFQIFGPEVLQATIQSHRTN